MAMPSVLFFTPPSGESFVRLGRCGGRAKAGEKWPPVKLMFAASALRHAARTELMDAEGVMDARLFKKRAGDFLKGSDGPMLIVSEPTPGSIQSEARTAGMLREQYPGLISIAMGGFVSAIPEEVLEKYPAFDLVISGEAEETLREFIEEGCSRLVPGISGLREGKYESGGQREPLKNLDSLPHPAHDLIDRAIYRTPLTRRYPLTITETSRGCPYSCGFCNIRAMDGMGLRSRSIGHIEAEMQEIASLGFKEVKFNDPTFTADRKRVIEICRVMAASGLTWKCNTRADLIDPAMAEAMASSGCHAIYIGVEAASPEVQEYYGKKIPPETVISAVRTLREAGIESVLHFIFGAPPETPATIEASVRLAIEAGPDYAGFNILTPYPGTDVREDLKTRGLIVDSSWDALDQSNSSSLRSEAMSADELEAALKKAIRSFYLRPSYIAGRLKSLRSPSALIRQAGDAFRLLLR